MDARQIFSDAEVDVALLGDLGARIQHSKVGKIWQMAADISDDKTLSLHIANVIYSGMYHSLSMAMFAAENLLSVLNYMAKYRRIFHPLSRMKLAEVNDGFRFIWGTTRALCVIVGI